MATLRNTQNTLMCSKTPWPAWAVTTSIRHTYMVQALMPDTLTTAAHGRADYRRTSTPVIVIHDG